MSVNGTTDGAALRTEFHGGAYTVDEAAIRDGAGVEEETQDGHVAYARFPDPQPPLYQEGWLPSA